MRKAFLFPGQGVQHPGMGRDFIETFPTAKRTFEEADDLLGRKLSEIILHGPEARLTETGNSQVAIYVVSMAILRVLNEIFPKLVPDYCAGLSLGEYTAATAAGYLHFANGVLLVQKRGTYMNEACEAQRGVMAVVLGLSAEDVQKIVADVNLPNDLWAANFNCPGQVVISGTEQGVKIGAELAKARGAKRVLPLQVHGAFHSGLMESARKKLAPHLESVPLHPNQSALVMNVCGAKVDDPAAVREMLIAQVTSPVQWERGIRAMGLDDIGLYVEIGPGKTLAGFNKRIGVPGKTLSVESIQDLSALEDFLNKE